MNKHRKIKVIAHHILLKMDKDEVVKTEAGIILADSATKKKLEQFETGVILGIGNTAFSYLTEQNMPVPIELGNKVLVKKYSGVGIDENGGMSTEELPSHRIVTDEDVLAVVEEKGGNSNG